MSRMPAALPSAADDAEPGPAARTMAAEARLREAVLGDARFDDFELIEIVIARPGRVVARGRLGQEEVYLKLLPSAEGRRLTLAAEAEFKRMRGVMGEGRLRIARLVASAPERCLIAIEAVRGRRFDRAVATSAAAEQRRLYHLAGLWLDRYTSPTRRSVPFDPASFLAQIRGLAVEPSAGGSTRSWTRRWANAELAGEDRARREALRNRLFRGATEAAGTPVSLAATHDDFTPTNLTVTHAGGLVGYDISGWYTGAIADSSARLLTVSAPSGDTANDRCMGLDGHHVEGFVESKVLQREEADRLLPLYVGQKLDMMLGRHATRPESLTRLRRAIDAFLRGPGGLLVWLAQIGLVLPPLI